MLAVSLLVGARALLDLALMFIWEWRDACRRQRQRQDFKALPLDLDEMNWRDVEVERWPLQTDATSRDWSEDERVELNSWWSAVEH